MVKIHNKVLDTLARNNFTAYQIRVLFAIYIIHHQPCSRIHSLNSRIIQATGLSKGHVSGALNELKRMYVLTQSGRELIINKEVEQWLPKTKNKRG